MYEIKIIYIHQEGINIYIYIYIYIYTHTSDQMHFDILNYYFLNRQSKIHCTCLFLLVNGFIIISITVDQIFQDVSKTMHHITNTCVNDPAEFQYEGHIAILECLS